MPRLLCRGLACFGPLNFKVIFHPFHAFDLAGQIRSPGFLFRPFDRLKLVFGVEHGIINISEFLLDSPILKISGTARYDFIDDKFNGVVVASPLGQYSDLLKSVPLFGKLFSGERHGFDTAVFEVKGSAKDPSVVYLPAESLMAGAKGTAKLAFDLLVNAITLPEEAFSMVESDSPIGEDAMQEGARGL